VAQNQDSYRIMPLAELDPHPDNPRSTSDDAELGELVESMRSCGVLEPILVRAVGERWQIVAGHRRVQAAKAAGMTEIPAVILSLNDEAALTALLVENLQRADLSPLEEAGGYQLLLRTLRSQRKVAKALGVGQARVSRRLALLELPANALATLRRGELSLELAAAMRGLGEAEVDEVLAAYKPEAALARLKIKHEREASIAAKCAEAKARGLRIVEPDPDRPALSELGLNPDDHEAEECHALSPTPWGELEEVCTDPARHPRPKDPHALERERRQQLVEDREDQCKLDAAAREKIIAALLMHSPSAEVLGLLAYISGGGWLLMRVAGFLGVAVGKRANVLQVRETLREWACDSLARSQRLAGALALVSAEAELGSVLRVMWTTPSVNAGLRAYLALLVAAGHELSSLEQAALDGTLEPL
jgi:ParB/RepB/Spo0J family partition protein